ncbi:MAG: spore coat protein [marine bacterium B5-7]|nr:MAG: spore coat protein [marine bacterium B5-7]
MANSDFLPFAKPTIDEATIQEVTDCLRSGWLATGPRVAAFEQKLKDYLGAPHVICVTSGTAALHVSLLALGLQPGDEVITTPMTFCATLNTIVQAGGKPVLVDVDPKTFNLDLNRVADAITEKTRAILPVHFGGLPVDLGALYELAGKHNLRVIEDCAHAIGAQYKGVSLGSFGDTQIFSFHPNKNMTTGEGGAIATHNDELAAWVKKLRFHGIDRDAFDRFSKEGNQHYDIVYPGFKYNMMDIQAALGLHQIQQLDDFIQRRQFLAQNYTDILKGWPELTLPTQPNYPHRHAWHLYTPLINPAACGMDRDTFIAKMKEHNIGVGMHYEAVHLYSYYRDTYGFKRGDFPHAESISDRIVSLPLFPTMTQLDQDRVIETLLKVLRSPA